MLKVKDSHKNDSVNGNYNCDEINVQKIQVVSMLMVMQWW
jgi:hypothetical protein